MLSGPVRQSLAARNGGPGITAKDLADDLGLPLAVVRQTLATMVFREGIATCDGEGRFKLGDPTAVVRMGA